MGTLQDKVVVMLVLSVLQTLSVSGKKKYKYKNQIRCVLILN